MRKRLITGTVLALILIPAILFGGIYYLIFAMFFAYVGTFELLNMFNKKDDNLNIVKYIIPVLSSVFMLLLYLTIKSNPYNLYFLNGKFQLIFESGKSTSKFISNLCITGFYTLSCIIGMLIFNIFKDKTNAHTMMSMITSFVYGGVLLSTAFTVEYLPVIKVSDSQALWGGQIFGYLYLIVALTDIFAYFIGSKFGRHKLCPDISPKKSVEGAIGGLVLGSIVGTIFAFVFDVAPMPENASGLWVFVSIILFFLLSVLISFVVQVGDLVASKLKRTYEIKDYGFIFPGHGGVMDRFDSLILSGSFVFALYLFITFII